MFLGWVWPPALSQVLRAAEPTAGVTPCPRGLDGAETSWGQPEAAPSSSGKPFQLQGRECAVGS